MEDLHAARKESTGVEPRGADLFELELDEPSLGHSGTGRRQKSHLMAQLSQPSGEPYDDSLRPTIATDRQDAVGVEGNVHGGAMYRQLQPLDSGVGG